jgi:hypothetical protein
MVRKYTSAAAPNMAAGKVLLAEIMPGTIPYIPNITAAARPPAMPWTTARMR